MHHINFSTYPHMQAQHLSEQNNLRMEHPCVTARRFCTSRIWSEIVGFLFCAVYEYVKKADLSKGYQNPKRKLGATMHFSEVIELRFGKKMPYILCISSHS